jgi:hypothetical protein
LTAEERGVLVVREVHRVIRHYFPDIFKHMDLFGDGRGRRKYRVSELVTGAIAMFLFKEGSRNAFNGDMDERFRDNYYKVFKLRLPHMDTANAFLGGLAPSELEGLKAAMVAALIDQRALHRFKFLGAYFTVAIDGTGAGSSDLDNDEGNRTHKTSKNGATKYYDYMLDAKLVTPSGLSISLASEPVHNETGRGFKKQDCEMKAFARLAAKLKKHFPKLPICILADGLYPNRTFMETCTGYGWAYIAVLQDGNLKALQEDVTDTENKNRHTAQSCGLSDNGRTGTQQAYGWISEPLSHGAHTVYWLSCTETVTKYGKGGMETKTTAKRFVYLTDQKLGKGDRDKVVNIVAAGRDRWKIENEGYNTQKNQGYGLGHKFSRGAFTAIQNYYQCIQIAHLVNQLVAHSEKIAGCMGKATLTIKLLWKDLVAVMKMCVLRETQLELESRFQIRLAG